MPSMWDTSIPALEPRLHAQVSRLRNSVEGAEVTDPRDPVKVLLEECAKAETCGPITGEFILPLARALRILVEALKHETKYHNDCWMCEALAAAAREVTHE